MSYGFMNGFLGDSDQAWRLGQRLGLVFNDVKGGMAKGEAMREARAEADRLNGREVEVDGPTEWTVDGEKFANHQEAARFAKDTGLSLMDVKRNDTKQTQRFDQANGKGVDAESLYFNKYLPAQVQKLRANGWGTQADQLEDYTRSEVGKQYASNYARMLQAHAAGNFDAAAKHLEKLQELNSERHTAAVKPTGDGGYAVTLTDPESGEKREVELAQERLMGDMGLFAHMDPAKMVERFDTQEKTKATNLAKVATEKEQTRRQLALKGLDYRYDVARDQLKYQQDLAKLIQQHNLDLSKPTDKERVYNWLERNGQPRAVLDEYVEGIVRGKGDDGVRQAPNPQDLVRQYISDRTQNEDGFINLPPEEQMRRATEYVRRVQQAFPSSSARATQTPPPARPSTNGLPPMLR